RGEVLLVGRDELRGGLGGEVAGKVEDTGGQRGHGLLRSWGSPRAERPPGPAMVGHGGGLAARPPPRGTVAVAGTAGGLHHKAADDNRALCEGAVMADPVPQGVQVAVLLEGPSDVAAVRSVAAAHGLSEREHGFRLVD